MPDRNDRSTASMSAAPNDHRRWITWFVLVLFAAMALIPIASYGLNGELARWKTARAKLLAESGKTSDAVAWMERAVAQSPDDEQLQLYLARLLVEDARAEEALPLVDAVLKTTASPIQALRLRSNVLLSLDRKWEALEATRLIGEHLRPIQRKNRDRLNELAYMRALAATELPQAKRDIDSATLGLAADAFWADRPPLPLRDQLLVAASVISRETDHRDRVLQLLNKRIDQGEAELQSRYLALTRNAYRNLQRFIPFAGDLEEHFRQLVDQNARREKALAYVYSARALLMQDLNRPQDRDRDRLAAKRLGYDPNEIVEQIPDNWTLLFLIYNGAQYLDTRAMVYQGLGGSQFRESALDDFNAAVLAASLLTAASGSAVPNTMHDESGERFSSSVVSEFEAVLRKHRAELLVAMNHEDQAEADFQRIEELGFDRDENLF